MCSRLIDYCVYYCTKGNDDTTANAISNASSNCLCECVLDDLHYNNLCVSNKHDIFVYFILIPLLILISCICCLRKKRASTRIQSPLPYINPQQPIYPPQITYIDHNDNDLPKYYEIININDNTPMPLYDTSSYRQLETRTTAI